MRHALHRIARALAAVALVSLWLSPAVAADQVRVGKSLGSLWAFLPPDIGAAQGIFARYGIALEILDLGNGGKLQQAMASDSIDFGLGAGTDLAFPVKGSPVRAVAAFAEEPRTVVVIVHPDPALNSVADLKGKLLAMPGIPSVAQWLVWQMALAQGWDRDAVRTVGQGSVEANVASFLTGQVDGIVDPVELGFKLGDQGKGRILVRLAQYAPHFHSHVIFARNALIARNPDLVERFLKGFFASVAAMKADKDLTTRVAMDVLHDSRAIAERSYDYEISMLIDDGSFDPAAVAVLKRSFVDMGLLSSEPEDDQMFTRRFVPVRF